MDETVTGEFYPLQSNAGTHITGVNVGRGGDDTLFAKVEGMCASNVRSR